MDAIETVAPLSAEETDDFKELPRHERRFLDGSVEVARSEAGPRLQLTIPFNRESEKMTTPRGMEFVEVIRPSAFRKTLKERRGQIVALWNHDPAWVLGRLSNGTMEVRETDAALVAEVQLSANDPFHAHFAERVERRDVTGSSFGFDPIRTPVHRRADGILERELVEVSLLDLSPVTFPAYSDSEVEKRGHRAAIFDVASVRAGGDLAALAAAIVRMEQGRFAEADAAEVRSWVERLQKGIPAPVPAGVPVDILRRRLNLRARQLGIAA